MDRVEFQAGKDPHVRKVNSDQFDEKAKGSGNPFITYRRPGKTLHRSALIKFGA